MVLVLVLVLVLCFVAKELVREISLLGDMDYIC